MKCAWLTLAMCGTLYGQTQVSVATAPKGSIEGQVVNAKTGTPLKKVTVRLSMVNQGGNGAPAVNRSVLPAQISTEINQALASLPVVAAGVNPGPATSVSRPVVRTVDTDEQGRFSFAGLDSGKYRLAAERQGFLRQSYGERKYSGGGTPVLVGDGQNVKSILFRLNPQGVITGKVLDEDGDPVPNVQVRAMRYMYAGGTRKWIQVGGGNTSDIGEYRLPDLQPGRYLVSTDPRNIGRNIPIQMDEPLPQNPDMTYAATYYPSTTDATTGVPIEVGAGGEIRGIDVRLVKTRVWRVRGKVNGPGGERGRGAIQVGLTPAEGPANNRLMAVARPPDGLFEIRNVPSGSYTLHAQSQAGGQTYAAVLPVQVTGSHVEGLVLNLTTGGDLQGVVKLIDATTPIDLKNVSVMLRPVGILNIGGAPQRARVDDSLKFIIKGVPPIKFAASVLGIPVGCYLKSVQFGGRDLTSEGLDMSAGGPMEVVISAAAAQIDAVVTDKDGKSTPNAVVALVPKDGGNPIVQTTDENGILSVKSLRPGDYKLVAWEDVEQGAPQDPDFLAQFEKQMKSLKLDASGHEAVQLTAIPADDK